MAKQAVHLSAPRLCSNQEAVSFVKTYEADAAALAKSVAVPTENILGLAAQESQYGGGRIAREYKNFFSMHAPAAYQIGEAPALGNAKVHVAIFPSFRTCGESFLSRFGAAIRGAEDPEQFAKALVSAHFNSGDAATGGRTGFASYLVGIIRVVKGRMTC